MRKRVCCQALNQVCCHWATDSKTCGYQKKKSLLGEDSTKPKAFLSYILIIGLILSFIGCAPQKTLTIAMSLAEDEWDVFRRDIFPPFEKEHRARIKAYQIEPGQLAAKLEALEKAGKSEIDLFAQDNMSLNILIDEDLVLDLSEYESQIPEEILPNIIGSSRFDSRLMFMPFRPNVQIVYYNQDAFRTYDLSPPKRWDELIEVARKFKESEGGGRILLTAVGGNPTAMQLYEFILQADGEPYAFDDAGCIQTFRFLKKLWQYVSEESLRAKWDTTNDLLAHQKAYLAQNWPFGIKALKEYKPPFVFVTYSGWKGPAGEHHLLGGDVFGIPKNTENKKLALDFIRYIQSKEAQEILVAKLGWPSLREDAYGEDENLEASHYDAVKEAMKYARFRENVTWWPAYAKYVTEAFREIVINQAPVEETLKIYKIKLEEEKSLYK